MVRGCPFAGQFGCSASLERDGPDDPLGGTERRIGCKVCPQKSEGGGGVAHAQVA